MWHPLGTCRMGSDENAVVDARLRIDGIKGLGLIDASIMPNIVSGNTNAPTMALADCGAELFVADTGINIIRTTAVIASSERSIAAMAL